MTAGTLPLVITYLTFESLPISKNYSVQMQVTWSSKVQRYKKLNISLISLVQEVEQRIVSSVLLLNFTYHQNIFFPVQPNNIYIYIYFFFNLKVSHGIVDLGPYLVLRSMPTIEDEEEFNFFFSFLQGSLKWDFFFFFGLVYQIKNIQYVANGPLLEWAMGLKKIGRAHV